MAEAKLSARAIATLKKPGLHGDGGNLYLKISETGGKSWLFRYWRDNRSWALGLGPLSLVSAPEAREKARAARRLLFEGKDPQEHARTAKAAQKAARASRVRFRDAAMRYVTAHSVAWKSDVHRRQWLQSMEDYAFPLLGDLSCDQIDTAAIMAVLEPIWISKPTVAARLRGRIEQVLDLAAVAGHREGPNPSRWRGHLALLLPATAKVRATEHHAALAHAEAPAFMAALRARQDIPAKALELLILCGVRRNEATEARWSEIDVRERLWTIPGARMKGGKPHRVPLSTRALEILASLPRIEGNPFIFAGSKPGQPINRNGLAEVIAELRPGEAITVHGWRSTLRDWGGEKTSFAREVLEAALAHSTASGTEAAYARSDLLEKRRAFLEQWSRYCASDPTADATVLPLRRDRA